MVFSFTCAFAAKEPARLRRDPSASWLRLVGEAARLSSPLQLPLISPFFGPVMSHSSASFLSDPEQTRRKGARVPEISRFSISCF